MRKVVFIVLLAVSGSSAAIEWSDWTVVENKEAFTLYADTSTIRRNGDLAQMWDMSDSKSGRALGGVKQSLSFKLEREYDCNRQQLRVLYTSWHSGNMGGGEILGSDSNAGAWRPVLLGTIGDKLWRFACKK